MPHEKLSVADAYEGKSVLLTGASGYLGAILLEILLRCCPGIKKIYILLREKKGLLPEARKEVIFEKEIFWKVRRKMPDVLHKVHVASGDMSEPDLGMTPEVLSDVVDDVTIVFHCAAVISFLKPLRFMLSQNLGGVRNVLNLCRKLKKLDALVYTSTAYSNACRLNDPVEEKIYKTPVSPERFLEELNKEDSDEVMLQLMEQCPTKWPNVYAFSKSLSENLVARQAADLPVAIVRPSIITCCWKGVQPGYIEKGSGMVLLALGIGKGFIRVIRCDADKRIDHVPCDVTANAHIVAVANLLQTPGPESPLVVNCVSSEFAPCTWGHYAFTLLKLSYVFPIPRAYQRASLTLKKNAIGYWISAILDHYAPAYVYDAVLRLSGKKARLVGMYKFFDKSMAVMQNFTLNEWDLRCENYKGLMNQLTEVDKKTFYMDLSDYDVEDLSKKLPIGAPFYRESDTTLPEERARITYNRAIYTSLIKWFLVGWIFVVIAFVFFRIV